MLHAAPLEQGKTEVGRLAVGEWLVCELLAGIEVAVVRAGDQGRAGRESQLEPVSKVERPRPVVPGGEHDDFPGGGGVDGGLDGDGVVDHAVASRAVVADAPGGSLSPGSKRGGGGEPGGGESPRP